MNKDWSSWLIFGLAILLILLGILTILNPGGFWNWINILLGISLIFSGISSVANAIRNQKQQYISFLFIIGILAVILGILLIGAKEANFVGKLMVWMFALWAFMRGGMLIFFGFQNRDTMPLWWGISILGGVLVLLAILTAISSAGMANLVGICIGISIIFDGLSLLFFSLKGGKVETTQVQIITQAQQNEIAQGDVVVTETVVTTNDTNNQPQN